jgi:hypothetical protein
LHHEACRASSLEAQSLFFLSTNVTLSFFVEM